MIKYTLKCSDDHRFESWFQDSAAFDRLSASGHLSCAVCGSTDVEKAIMAPRLGASDEDGGTELPAPQSPAEAALRLLKAKIEAESDYVGDDFAQEARRIHEGDAKARAIHGEATWKDAKALVEDDIPVAPLPFFGRKTN